MGHKFGVFAPVLSDLRGERVPYVRRVFVIMVIAGRG